MLLILKKNKKIWFYIFLGIEMTIFARYLINGKYGMHARHALLQEKKQLEATIDLIKHEVELFRNEIHLWQTYPFYKEKAAREQLQMCYDDEIIYVTRPNIKQGVS